MNLMVNGETMEIGSGVTVSTLLTRLNLVRERVAIEINFNIVPRVEYETHTLADGDAVEIVHFVGGG